MQHKSEFRNTVNNALETMSSDLECRKLKMANYLVASTNKYQEGRNLLPAEGGLRAISSKCSSWILVFPTKSEFTGCVLLMARPRPACILAGVIHVPVLFPGDCNET